MIDFVGNELSLGNSVVLMAPQYRMFVVGKIIAFTPKNVRVAFINTWNFGPSGRYSEVLQDSTQLVRIDSGELSTRLNIEKERTQ